MSARAISSSGTSTVNSNLPISKLIYNGTSTSSTSGSSSSTNTTQADANITSQLGPSAFLQLLTTQLSNQDPLNPVDDTQSVSQLAQFSALQSSDNLATAFSNFQSNFAVLQSANLIGATVSVNSTDPTTGNSSTISGVVNSIQVTNGVPSFTLYNPTTKSLYANSSGQPLTFSTSQILGISGSAASGSSSSTGSGSSGSGSTNSSGTSGSGS
jgi:flagellar basal-body rod modification protein FlgD